MMIKLFLPFVFVDLILTDEHYFAFNQNQFPGFSTPLFKLISTETNKTNLSFTLLNYERVIKVDQSNEETVKLSIERADLLSNALNHMIFIVVRQEMKLDVYVNCKLIDSYLVYSIDLDRYKNISFKVENLTQGIEYFQLKNNGSFDKKLFKNFGCKQIIEQKNESSSIGRALIRKMEYVIGKIGRTRRDQNSVSSKTDSFTIVYKPLTDQINSNQTNSHKIFYLRQLNISIEYCPNENLFHIQFNNENHTQLILYADKSNDLHESNSLSSIVIFLHVTPMMITCYVNCELTDQEFMIDSVYFIEKIKDYSEKSFEYNRQSTLIVFNKSIEEIGTSFYCLKLEKKNDNHLPEKYVLRKFTNALDILVNDLYIHSNNQTFIQNISTVNIHSINGFGNLIAPSLPTDTHTAATDTIEYNKLCLTDLDCNSNKSFLQCLKEHCSCPTRYFWSGNLHRCILCRDLSIGNRCFRLSNHKSTWYEANDYCQDDNTIDNNQNEYSMKFATNINRTDIELIKQSLLNDNDSEQLDYYYWIGLINSFNGKNSLKEMIRTKRHAPIMTFYWYDNHEKAQINIPDLWCSKQIQFDKDTLKKNELCVSVTSCGLYVDDCQRNFRFLCEAF